MAKKERIEKKYVKKPVKNKMKAVKDLIEKGKKSGVLSYGEIMDALEDIEDLDAEQIDKIYESMEEMGIEVLNDGKVQEEETLEEDPLKK